MDNLKKFLKPEKKTIVKGDKMVNKNHSFNLFIILVVIGILLLSPTTLVAEISGTELLNILREKDQITKAVGYKISFLLTEQAHRSDPNQGIVIEDCEATWTPEGSFAMKKTNHYEKDIPVFAALGTRGYRSWDYDHDGNLVVWRDIETYILFGPERNDRIQYIKAFRVDPNGKLVREGHIKRMLHRYPIGNKGNTFEFDKLQLATGQGFSKDIHNITSVKTLPSDLLQVTAHRQDISRHTWELTIDPNLEYLVRKAILMREGANKPTILVTSGGLMVKDELKIGKYGTYKYSVSPEILFEVAGISKVVGPNKLYEEVLSRLNSPLTPGSSIVDLRGEKPVRTTVE